MNSPFSVPNTNAFGPSLLRRSRIAASRPFGSNGIRRFSLSFAVVSGDADRVRVPIAPPVLNQQHLAAPATQLQRSNDPVVHQRSDVPMLPRVHGERRVKETLLLF